MTKHYLLFLMTLTLIACGNTKTPNDSTVNVRTKKVEMASNGVTKNYVGTIEEEEGANVTFSVLGTVARVLVKEGQFVSKGQALAISDGEDIRNAYQMSKVTLDQAEDAYRRLKNLYNKGTLPEMRMVEMEANLQRARSAEAISRKNLNDITLRAPWSGYVAEVNLHEGANITPGMNGIKLVKIENVKLSLPIPEKEIGQVKTGQKVTFTITALGEREFSGVITSRGMTTNPISHAYDVKVLVSNADHALLPGMVAKAKLSMDNSIFSKSGADYALLAPQEAIMVSGTDKFVWIVKGGKAERRPVTTGDITNEGVVIESGLTKGETIIVQGQEKVCNGQSVREIK